MTVLIARARALPRATLAATLFLMLCSIVAFAFMVQRGGLYLPVASPAISPSAPGASETAQASPTVGASPAAAAAQASLPAVRTAPTSAPTAATNGPSASAGGGTPAPASPAIPSASPVPTPLATPRASAAPRAGSASASRLAVLVTCPDRADCYTYTIRTGDNVWSIAAWFGVPMDRVVALNPWLGSGHLVVAGQQLVIPTPSR